VTLELGGTEHKDESLLYEADRRIPFDRSCVDLERCSRGSRSGLVAASVNVDSREDVEGGVGITDGWVGSSSGMRERADLMSETGPE
jgi:hypothetical protein